MISRRQKMVALWKKVRFIEIIQPDNAFVKNLMYNGVYSADFTALNEDILDLYSDIDTQYNALYADTEHHRAIKNTIDAEYA